MRIHTIKSNSGSKKSRKIVGRGNSSGHGTYSTRGCKGQGQHASRFPYVGHEGGQTPLDRRLPKVRGKARNTNPNRIEYQPVNLSQLNEFEDGATVTALELHTAGMISHKSRPVKVLGMGELTCKLTLKVDKISAVAKAAVEKAGGEVTVRAPRTSEHREKQIAKTATKKAAKKK